MVKQIIDIALRECGILWRNPIYAFCMIVFPLLVIVFFTSMLQEGQPTSLPVGVVDQDNTATSRQMIRRLDSFQSSHVVAHYPNINEARQAIQRNEIYAFLLIPKGTTDELLSQRQPRISFYFSSVSMVAGSMIFRDLKTMGMLSAAQVGAAKLSALGKTEREIGIFLQPIVVDLHQVGNPWTNYNVYLSTMLVPGLLMLFIFLITAYALGTELKFNRGKEWMALANQDARVALLGKFLPHFIVFLTIFLGFEIYIFYGLNFPHPGGLARIVLVSVLAVFASQSFGIFAFGLMPSLRMSMSICSLWAVLSFTMSGATYPVFAMNPMIESMAQLFPLRHFYMIYQMNIFNGYPLVDGWFNFLMLLVFILLPVFVLGKIRRAMLEYVYIP